MIQSMSGMMSITGSADDVAGGGPQRLGVALTDILTGVYASTAILAAIEARHQSGRGQHIDMALLDVGMAILANQGAGFLNTGKVPQRQGNSHPSLAPYQDFVTADGSMLLAIGNDGQFARFCEAAGYPRWAQDARFASNTLRVKNREALVDLMQTATRTRSTAQWITLLETRAVPCGPINDLAQAFAEEQVHARGLVVQQDRQNPEPTGAKHIRTVASPLRLSETPTVLRHAPPALGEHTDEVLMALGLNAQAIAALRHTGVV
jgi:formyl-CoA transferase